MDTMEIYNEETLIAFLEKHPNFPTLKIAKYFYGVDGTAKDVNWLLHSLRDEGKLAKSEKSDTPGPPTWHIATEIDRIRAIETQNAKNEAIAAKKLERSRIIAEKKLEKNLALSTKVKGGKKNFNSLESSPSNSQINDSSLLSPKKKLNMGEYISNKNERDRLVREITDRVNTLSLGDLRELSSALNR